MGCLVQVNKELSRRFKSVKKSKKSNLKRQNSKISFWREVIKGRLHTWLSYEMICGTYIYIFIYIDSFLHQICLKLLNIDPLNHEAALCALFQTKKRGGGKNIEVRLASIRWKWQCRCGEVSSIERGSILVTKLLQSLQYSLFLGRWKNYKNLRFPPPSVPMTRKPPQKMELFGPINSPRHLLEVYCCWIFSPILLKWRANSGNSNGGLKFSSEIWCFCLFKVDYGYGGSWIHI